MLIGHSQSVCSQTLQLNLLNSIQRNDNGFNFIQFYRKNWPKHVLCAETEKMVNFGNMKFSSFIEDLDVGPYIFRLHIPKDNVNGSKFL